MRGAIVHAHSRLTCLYLEMHIFARAFATALSSPAPVVKAKLVCWPPSFCRGPAPLQAESSPVPSLSLQAAESTGAASELS